MLVFALISDDMSLAKNSYLGLANGILFDFTIGFLPYLENLFGITSSIKLLELSNPNQPLLRRLLLEAPVPITHSILVGNLAEAAAEAVNADGLWLEWVLPTTISVRSSARISLWKIR